MSTGIGACMAAGVYEVGRPKRYSLVEAAEIDSQWLDFGMPLYPPIHTCTACLDHKLYLSKEAAELDTHFGVVIVRAWGTMLDGEFFAHEVATISSLGPF